MNSKRHNTESCGKRAPALAPLPCLGVLVAATLGVGALAHAEEAAYYGETIQRDGKEVATVVLSYDPAVREIIGTVTARGGRDVIKRAALTPAPERSSFAHLELSWKGPDGQTIDVSSDFQLAADGSGSSDNEIVFSLAKAMDAEPGANPDDGPLAFQGVARTYRDSASGTIVRDIQTSLSSGAGPFDVVWEGRHVELLSPESDNDASAEEISSFSPVVLILHPGVGATSADVDITQTSPSSDGEKKSARILGTVMTAAPDTKVVLGGGSASETDGSKTYQVDLRHTFAGGSQINLNYDLPQDPTNRRLWMNVDGFQCPLPAFADGAEWEVTTRLESASDRGLSAARSQTTYQYGGENANATTTVLASSQTQVFNDTENGWIDLDPSRAEVRIGIDGILHFSRELEKTYQGSPGAQESVSVDYDMYACLVCPGDLDFNYKVDGADMVLLMAAWGSTENRRADLDRDGIVSNTDLIMLFNAWGPCNF